MPRAAEFATGSRQSLGLSVITNEGSTTKKLIVAMRLFGPLHWAIIKATNASNAGDVDDTENVRITAQLQQMSRLDTGSLPVSKTFFLTEESATY